MDRNIYIYILVSFGVTYLIRVLPLTLIKKEITNKTVRSFLYYVPYVTLSIMTFPSIVTATKEPLAGALALIAGAFLAYKGKSLLFVAVSSCAVVFICESLMMFL